MIASECAPDVRVRLTTPTTMVKLNREQRALLADKVPDVANLAAGALVFGQILSEQAFSWSMVALGLATWSLLFGFALMLKGRVR